MERRSRTRQKLDRYLKRLEGGGWAEQLSVSKCRNISARLGEQWGRIPERGLILQLRVKVMDPVLRKLGGAVLDGLMLLTTLFKIESKTRRFCNGYAACQMLPWITYKWDS